jgi:hypothetical protein
MRSIVQAERARRWRMARVAEEPLREARSMKPR